MKAAREVLLLGAAVAVFCFVMVLGGFFWVRAESESKNIRCVSGHAEVLLPMSDGERRWWKTEAPCGEQKRSE